MFEISCIERDRGFPIGCDTLSVSVPHTYLLMGTQKPLNTQQLKAFSNILEHTAYHHISLRFFLPVLCLRFLQLMITLTIN